MIFEGWPVGSFEEWLSAVGDAPFKRVWWKRTLNRNRKSKLLIILSKI
jgi:hypothetical protein